ncbi:MAG: sigma-54 dependent transcriptional regulator [Burkholderiaceae bacterium]|jgi:two-component system response regulator PilR (NtrC family)|nr:sigma-54 dependent transcriptional regulator [Burkholderiaceae bacterium]
MNEPTASRTGQDPARRSPAVLVVDDEADLRELVALTLVRLGLDVDGAESLARAREFLARQRYALVLTDMRLPDGVGLDLVREVAQGKWRDTPPIAVITAFGSPENAVAALKAGAFDYLTKPVDLEQLRLLVRSALREGPDRGERPAGGGTRAVALARLLGESASMRQLRAMIERLGHSMAPVAIRGESGSGKELVARAIHECSARAAAPFVAVNCGAIPETLMEAEFFGYRKGAFTGADRDRDGFFQAAAGGTLFLDEVAELPLPMQVKLLRAIQERRVRRVGATGEEPVDVRLLSATHQDLGKLVAGARFRQDLFYRLNVIELRVPPLRERADDIALIADALLGRIAERSSARRAHLSADAAAALCRHAFPGNVRELENVLERAVALATEDELQPIDLMLPQPEVDLLLEPEPPEAIESPPSAVAAAAFAPGARADAVDAGAAAEVSAPSFSVDNGVPSDLAAYLDAIERDAIRAALARTGHNRTAAAQLLGLTFRQLRYRMHRLGLR